MTQAPRACRSKAARVSSIARAGGIAARTASEPIVGITPPVLPKPSNRIIYSPAREQERSAKATPPTDRADDRARHRGGERGNRRGARAVPRGDRAAATGCGADQRLAAGGADRRGEREATRLPV